MGSLPDDRRRIGGQASDQVSTLAQCGPVEETKRSSTRRAGGAAQIVQLAVRASDTGRRQVAGLPPGGRQVCS